MFLSVHFLNPVFTTLSANPLVAGWYGADVTCLMPFFCKNCLNSVLVNVGPLSDIICSGKPNLAYRQQKLCILQIVSYFNFHCTFYLQLLSTVGLQLSRCRQQLGHSLFFVFSEIIDSEAPVSISIVNSLLSTSSANK